SLIITETPVSLVEHGKKSSGHTILQNIKGVEDVDSEFEQMVIANKIAQEVKHPCNKLMNRYGMPPIIIGVMLQFFQQFTRINAIVFYAIVLFQTIGFKNDASLLSSVITGSVNVFVSVFAVVKFSRRILLLQASIQMFVCQLCISFNILEIKIYKQTRYQLYLSISPNLPCWVLIASYVMQTIIRAILLVHLHATGS
ncbi:hypothetical protein Gorai_006154, partial [Gossypium raimondii]|nr:hypothetical protein [Gossypium raimondii]